MDRISSKRGFFQTLVSLFHKKPAPQDQVEGSEEVLPAVSISRPDLKFHILDAFKRQELYFVDLDNGDYINGLIDIPSLGLTFSAPAPEQLDNCEMGFIHLNHPKALANEDTFELDAVLYFDYDGPECKTGFLADGSQLFFLKVWNDTDLQHWEAIVNQVVNELTVKTEDGSVPLAKFIISTVFVPDRPEDGARLVLTKKKADSCSADAVSDQPIPIECDDEELDFRKIHRPRF